MTKTHSRMKWLVLALLVVIIAGAVALALSLHAHADGKITFRVIISKDATQANNYARAQGWIGLTETCRSNSTLQSSNTDNPVFRFENPQLFNTYGLSTGQKDDARSLRKYLSEHHLGANDFNTEIMIYVLNDVIWVNTHSNSISGLSSRSTLTDADGNFPAKDLTWHFVGVTGYYDQETRPTIYWDMGQEASGSNAAADANAYVYIYTDLIVDNVDITGACYSDDPDADNNVYKAGYVSTGAINTGRYQKYVSKKVYFSVIANYGATIEVKNGGGIYDGTANGKGTTLTRILNGAYSNARLSVSGNILNATYGDKTHLGKLILSSGNYTTIQTIGNGKFGIATSTPSTAPTAESTDLANLTGDYYNYKNAADLALSVDGDDSTNPSGWGTASNWRHYNYDGGQADGYVTVDGTAVVDNLYAGNTGGDCQTGIGATAHITVNGGTVNSIFAHWTTARKVISSSNTQFSMVQCGSIEVNVNGGTLERLQGGFFNAVDGNTTSYSTTTSNATTTSFQAVATNMPTTVVTINTVKVDGTETTDYTYNPANGKVTLGSAPAKNKKVEITFSYPEALPFGQAHALGDLTVNVKDGNFVGSQALYTVYNGDAQRNGVDKEGCVIHGNVHFTFGDPEHPGVGGPTFNSNATMRGIQGSVLLAAEASHVVDVYGGTYNRPFWATNAGTLCKTTEVNLYGGHFAHVGGGFASGSTGTGITYVTENVSGKNLSRPVRTVITVDGAEIEEMYGGRSGGTNTSTAHNISGRNILKSGTIGKYFMLSDANQSGRAGASDATVSNEALYWTTLGDPSYDKNTKPLTIGEYYAASEWAATNNGLNKLYCGNAMMITQAYQNVVLDPDALGGTYSGEFYALGRMTNPEGDNSGAYYVDVVLDTHGFDLDSRSNDSLFANVRAEGTLSGTLTPSSITIKIAGLDAEHKTVITKGVLGTSGDNVIDTDDGVLISNIVANPNLSDGGKVDIPFKSGIGLPANKTVPVYVGDVNIVLDNVTIGAEGNGGYVNLLQTMQYKGDISNTLTNCTVNGSFIALSNAPVGVPNSYASNITTGTKSTVTNTLTNTDITRHYYGSAVNSYVCADVTNTLDDCTIGGNYNGGMVKLNTVEGSDGNYDSAGGVYCFNGFKDDGNGKHISDSDKSKEGYGARMIGTIANTLSDCEITGNFSGGNQNSANASSGITNTVTDTEVGGLYYGTMNASSTGGNVTNTISGVTVTGNFYGYGGTGTLTGNVINNINGLDLEAQYFGGARSTGTSHGTINGTVTNTITALRTIANETEKSFYAGSDAGPITKSGQTAIYTIINPATDADFFLNGLMVAGSSSGKVTGNVVIDLCGGVQHSNRHLVIGNRQDDTGKFVDGTVTANIYGGNWGTVFLGARNNSTTVDVTGITSVTGGTTLNLYGGSVASVRKGYYNSTNGWTNSSYGTATVKVYTTTPAEMPAGATLQNLVIRNSIDGARQTFTGEGMTASEPYTVNVIAGSRTLYYAASGYTYADGTISNRSASGSIAADSFTGTKLYIAPVNNDGVNNEYYYPITVFGDTGYKTGADTIGVLYEGVLGQYDWNETLDEATGAAVPMVTLIGETDTDLVEFVNTTYSTLTPVIVDGNATWAPNDMRLKSHYGTQIVMDAKFTVRVLFEEAKVEAAQTGVVITCAVNDGEAQTMTLTKGEVGTSQEGYYYFDVTGISAAAYKDTEIHLTIAFDDLPVRNVTISGTTIIGDMTGSGDSGLETLGAAIDEFTTALGEYFKDENAEIDAGTVDDVSDTDVNALIDANDNDKEATSSQKVMEENIKAIGVNLKITDVVTINFWFQCKNDATIYSAAIGTHNLVNGELTCTQRENDEHELTDYWTVSYECNGADLYSMLTLTINDGSVEFNACPLTYAMALREQDNGKNANLAQTIINYAYYVSQYAVAA